MSPATYAAARRSATLRSADGSAPRTAATTAQQGIITPESNRNWINVRGNITGHEADHCAQAPQVLL
jgi:hypothetical protein